MAWRSWLRPNEVFYGPYAYYVMTFNYENGRQPGFVVGVIFSVIVVVGNVIMNEVCGLISDWVGFRFRDVREAGYMILYTAACYFNVALDFITIYSTAEKVMEGLDSRTYFGVPLQDVPSFTPSWRLTESSDPSRRTRTATHSRRPS